MHGKVPRVGQARTLTSLPAELGSARRQELSKGVALCPLETRRTLSEVRMMGAASGVRVRVR